MAAAASRARTPPRSIAQPPTWPDTWPRTWWPQTSPTGSSSRWPTPSAPPIPSRWPWTRSAPSGSTRSGSSASCGTRSTSGQRRSSASSTSAGRSTRRRRPTVTSAARSSPGRRPTAPTSSAARSTNPSTDERILSGPVDICVDRAVLSLDQVSFHGRLVRGWVLGSSEDVPDRMLPVRKAVSPVRFFDPSMLEVLRWVSERYVAPLASVIARSYPPRVASEETIASVPHRSSAPVLRPDPARILPAYRAGSEMLGALQAGAGAFVVRPAPEDEPGVAVEAVGAALAGGRSAIVLVPEVEPLPATASAILEAYGDGAALFAGGSKRARYRMWLDIEDGAYPVVVGTRPAVFAPTVDLGLLYVSRESHVGHREERSPYYHVRDVALARARHSRAVCVMAALCPSGEAVTSGGVEVVPRVRGWPPVEVVRPGPEGRAPRLVSALKQVDRGFLFQPLPGYGVARVCRACGEPAACAACGGVLRSQAEAVRCTVCGANGACANCGGVADFGII